MHAVLIHRHGGSPGLRDRGALETALFRPQTGYYEDLGAEAAALFESLKFNHPFVDGNKRVAFSSMDVFLRINGHRVRGMPMKMHTDIIRMFESDTFNIANIDPWLRKRVIPTE